MTVIIDKTDLKKKYKKVAYYPGCALEGSAIPYDKSTRAIGKALGLELVDVKDWNCCGAMEVKNMDPEVETYLSSRVLSNAKHKNKLDVVMAPCNGCYKNLKQAEYELGHREKSRAVVDKISNKVGEEAYHAGEVETIHALDWIKHGYGEEELRKKIKGGLKGLKIANYYGCMYTRPRHIFPEKAEGAGGDSLTKPHYMDDLLAVAGAENVDFALKTACCGGAHTLSDRDMSTKLVLNILEAAEAAGAEVIATECPTCHSGLEMHQIRALKRLSKKTNVKVIYFTQLLGMAMGLSPRKVGLNGNISDSIGLLKSKGIV
ncbi:MAG TPA: disulfide reductase [Gammaproteobacteria bacterium]|nr:disulfide reductase [Gammaproteobacteria bacterium]